MNAIDLLKQQHEKIRSVLDKICEGASITPTELKKAADELVAHMVIEEHIFYPRVRSLVKELVQESFEEHAVARFELARVIQARGEDRRIRAMVLKEVLEKHIGEEENEMFPKVQNEISEDELVRLGKRMEETFLRATQMGLDKLVVRTSQDLRRVPVSRRAPSARRGRGAARTMRATPRKRGARTRARSR